MVDINCFNFLYRSCCMMTNIKQYSYHCLILNVYENFAGAFS